jgi:predicted lysophospholipase L1 biosynthesis ABC-type transport system permease subunit
MHEIGILKAIGTKNGAIGVIFGMQVVLIAALTCVMSTVGYFFFIDKADNILIDSLKRLAPGRIVMDLNFLSFSPGIAAMNCLLILALSAVSIIIPLVIIKRIKPVKIIKAKE